MIPWWWLIVACMLSGSFGAVVMAVLAVGARAEREVKDEITETRDR